MKIRLGGVAENVNLPWYELVDHQPFPGVTLEWSEFHGGTGAMVEALEAGEVDLVVALTEGIVAAVGRGCRLRLAGGFTASGLTWGAHAAAQSHFAAYDDLRDARFAISRFGSGSHIMAYVEAQRRGWDLGAIEFVEVGTLDGARVALANADADVFLWEKYTTKPLVDVGEWRRVGECLTPWPAFSIATRPEFEAMNDGDFVAQIINAVASIAGELSGDQARTAQRIHERFGLQIDDIYAWLTNNNWQPARSFDADVITTIVTTLRAVHVLESSLTPAQVVTAACGLS